MQILTNNEYELLYIDTNFNLLGVKGKISWRPVIKLETAVFPSNSLGEYNTKCKNVTASGERLIGFESWLFHLLPLSEVALMTSSFPT